jgi:hypothetical protein
MAHMSCRFPFTVPVLGSFLLLGMVAACGGGAGDGTSNDADGTGGGTAGTPLGGASGGGNGAVSSAGSGPATGGDANGGATDDLGGAGGTGGPLGGGGAAGDTGGTGADSSGGSGAVSSGGAGAANAGGSGAVNTGGTGAGGTGGTGAVGGAADCDTPGHWVQMATENAPTPTERRSTFWTGEEMIVISYEDQLALDAASYEPCSNHWEPVSIDGMPREIYYYDGRLDAPLLANGRLFFLYPGTWDNLSPLVSTVSAVVYDTGQDAWTEVPLAGAPAPADYPAIVNLGTHIFLWGGMTEPPQGDLGVLTNGGGLLDTETLTWTPIETAGAPTARAMASVAVAGDRVAVWGGALDTNSLIQCTSSCNYANDGGLYDPAIGEWEVITSEGAPPPRESATAYVADDRLVVWGGRDTRYLKDGGLYDLGSGTWTPIELALDTLGFDDSDNVFASLQPPFLTFAGPAETGIYDPRIDAMSLADTTNRQPLATSGLLNLGGVTMAWDGAGTEGHLWRLNAAAGRWQVASLPVEGQPLFGPGGIWTGTRIIAWGGATTEPDPDGSDGCENVPPGVACDPIIPTRSVYHQSGAHLIPAWE